MFADNPQDIPDELRGRFETWKQLDASVNALDQKAGCTAESMDAGPIVMAKLTCENLYGSAANLISDARSKIGQRR